jgi:hypothetical protein
MVEPGNDPATAPQTISLAAAAKLAFKATTTGWEADEQTLNRVARIIAWRVALFRCEAGESPNQANRVSLDQLAHGSFDRGGSILTFEDGRPDLTGLCIRTDELSLAILEVRASFSRGS